MACAPAIASASIGFNQPSFLETLFATARLAAIFVPLNFRLSGPELSYIINNAGIHSLVADTPHRPVIDTIRAELPCRRFFSADQTVDGWTSLTDLIATHEPLRNGATVANDEVAIIMFTSGTTGRPKGAMLTHGNLWWNNVNVLHAYDVRESDVSLLVAPLFHIGGLNVNFTGDLAGRAVTSCSHRAQLRSEAMPGRYHHLSRQHIFRCTRDAALPQPTARVRLSRSFKLGLRTLRRRTGARTADAPLCQSRRADQSRLRTDRNRAVRDLPLPRPRNGETWVRGQAANVLRGATGRCQRARSRKTSSERRSHHARAEHHEGPLEQSRGHGGGDRLSEDGSHTGDVGYLDEDGCLLFIADRLKDTAGHHRRREYLSRRSRRACYLYLITLQSPRSRSSKACQTRNGGRPWSPSRR